MVCNTHTDRFTYMKNISTSTISETSNVTRKYAQIRTYILNVLYIVPHMAYCMPRSECKTCTACWLSRHGHGSLEALSQGAEITYSRAAESTHTEGEPELLCMHVSGAAIATPGFSGARTCQTPRVAQVIVLSLSPSPPPSLSLLHI